MPDIRTVRNRCIRGLLFLGSSHGPNISWRPANARLRASGDSRPKRRINHSRSIVRTWSSTRHPVFPPNRRWRAERIQVGARGQGCDYEGPKMGIQLIRRYHHAGSGLLDLPPSRGFRGDQIDLATSGLCPGCHQCHSFRSKCVGVGASNNPTSAAVLASNFAYSAHPARGADTDSILIAPASTRSSTSSPSPAWIRRGLGIRTFQELPIRTMRVFMRSPRVSIATV